MTGRLKTTYGKYTVRFEGADPLTVIACFPLKTVAFPSRNDAGKIVSTSSGISSPKNPSAVTSGKHAEYNSRRSKPDRQDLILRRARDDSRPVLLAISMKSAHLTGQSAADSAVWLKLGATVGTRMARRRREFDLSDFPVRLRLPVLPVHAGSFGTMLRRSRVSLDAAVPSLRCRFSVQAALACCRFQRQVVTLCTRFAANEFHHALLDEIVYVCFT